MQKTEMAADGRCGTIRIDRLTEFVMDAHEMDRKTALYSVDIKNWEEKCAKIAEWVLTDV